MEAKPIKILHVIDSLATGGMERVVIDVVNGLDGADFDHAVCCLSRLGEGAGLLRGGVPTFDLGKGERSDYLMPLRIARLLNEFRPDIIHSQSWSGVDTALSRIITRRARLVHSEHGRSYPYIDGEGLKRRLARRFLYHVSDVVFSVSEELRDYYCRETGFSPHRMRVIRNGIDIRRLDSADPTGARGELGLAVSDIVIVTVSRLDRTKDTMTLLEAFHELVKRTGKSELRLLIVGDGDQRPRLQRFVEERSLGSAVVFAGQRVDVPRLLRASDAFALSSISEGMPLTVLEAMAASLPVVSTRVGALPEMVVEGETGFLISPRDPVTLAERLADIIERPDKGLELGRAGRSLVERNFTLDGMLCHYRDLYRSVAKINPKGEVRF